jgi:uncharacterized phage protein (TIGR02218 family)
MRPLTPQVSAWSSAAVQRRCTVWRFTRKDGLTLGFTDHDRPLQAVGVECQPARALEAGEIELTADLSPDVASLRGAIDSEALAEADLAAGLWDGALVEIFAVDWDQPSIAVSLFTGRLGEVSRSDQVFEAELRGLQAPLAAASGRTLAQRCDAQLGDARCKAPLAPHTVSAEIVAVLDERTISVSGLSAKPTGWADHGVIAFSSGVVRSISRHRAPGVLVLDDAVPPGLAAGQTTQVTAGCDKTAAMCRGRFQNLLNFQGFPHMPGNDALSAGPHAGEPRDGGSRFR